MLLFILLSFALPAYLLYKIINIWKVGDSALNLPEYVGADERLTVRALFTVFAGVCVIWRIILIIGALLVTFNFRRGLAEVFAQHRLKRRLKTRKGFTNISVKRLLKTFN